MSDDRLILVQDFFARFFGGHVDDAVKLLEPDVEYHAPVLAGPVGDFAGPAAVAKHLNKFLEIVEGPIDVLSWDDWLVGVVSVAGVVRLHLQRPGRLHEFRAVFLVGVSPNTKISRVECFYSDPAALERFFTG